MSDTLQDLDLAPPVPAAPAWMAGLESHLRQRTARLGVAGLGAVGLPLAELLHGAGFPVVGIDPDPAKRAALAAGRAPAAHQGHLDIEALAASPRFRVLAEAGDLAGSAPLDAYLICVPTNLDATGKPDLGAVRAAVRSIAPHLAPQALVVLESTTWPGTTREVVAAELAAAGRRPGIDVAVAFSPERVDPGRRELATIPKLVGGLDVGSGALGAELYGAAFDDVRRVSSPEVAEAAKLLENVYRAVNIALVNELKVSFTEMGLDVWEVLDAAATKPFGFQRFDPGPGVGGHCIPVDPTYLTWAARRAGAPAELVELAARVNRSMPGHVARVLGRALAARGKRLEGARLLLVGLAYKPGVDGTDHSPAEALASELSRAGAELSYHDRLIPRIPEGQAGLRELVGEASCDLTEARLGALDAVVLVTAHPGLDLDVIERGAALVIDTRGVLRDAMLGDPRYVSA